MKKLKLKKWVKVTLITTGIMIAIIISNTHMNDAIEKCVKSGHTQTYCENGLR